MDCQASVGCVRRWIEAKASSTSRSLWVNCAIRLLRSRSFIRLMWPNSRSCSWRAAPKRGLLRMASSAASMRRSKGSVLLTQPLAPRAMHSAKRGSSV